MSDTLQSLSPSRWHGKYHIVLVPKRRRKTMDGRLRKALGSIFHELARQKACRIMAIYAWRFPPIMRGLR
jgi:putative transposase